MLQNVLKNMREKENDQAELNIKLNINFEKDYTLFKTKDGTMEQRETIKPKFDHKVSSILKIKEEQSGTLIGDYELVFDAGSGEFVMRDINCKQVSIFDIQEENDWDTRR